MSAGWDGERKGCRAPEKERRPEVTEQSHRWCFEKASPPVPEAGEGGSKMEGVDSNSDGVRRISQLSPKECRVKNEALLAPREKDP